MGERDFYLGFSVFSGIGPIKFKNLLVTFESAERAWNASTLELSPVLGAVWTARFDTFRKEFSIEDYKKRLQKESVSFVAFCDAEYPQLLKEIKTPSIGLYVKGSVEVLHISSDKHIGIVGTRTTTSYGREVTALLTRELVQAGFVIVSGLAFGVDAITHKITVDNHGKTIAVLGCGVDCCSPRENLAIYNSIASSGGAVVSELPLTHPPTTGSFPARNRIIAGLSVATLVTEGAEDSGALITADYAFQYGRKVFAVPGQITSVMSKGPFKLLEKGAKLVTNASDILDHLHVRNGSTNPSLRSIVFSSKEEEIVGNLLCHESLTFDELVRKTGIDSAKLGTLLSMMEIKGMVKNEANGQISIVS